MEWCGPKMFMILNLNFLNRGYDYDVDDDYNGCRDDDFARNVVGALS